MERNEKNYFDRLFNIIKKNKIIIVCILIVFVLAGAYYSFKIVVPKYKSVSTVLLTSNNSMQNNKTVTQNDLSLNNNLIATYGTIIKSSKVLSQVIDNLQLDMSEQELYDNIKIDAVQGTQVIKVEVISESAIQAQNIAKDLDSVFINEIKTLYKIDNISIVDEASIITNPYNVNHIRDILISLLMGIGCVVVLISILYIFDTTIKIEQDIEDYIGLNVIGVVPLYKLKTQNELIIQNDSKSVVAEAFKTIRTNLSFSKSKKECQTILFASCNTSEGKSWITSNMAIAYAYTNKNVIVIDADMRKGRQHTIFNVTNEIGLSDYLTNMKKENDYVKLQKYIKETNIPRVHIMTIGNIPANPSELLSSNNFYNLLHMLRFIYDVIIIDGTPCNLVSDIIPVSRLVDSTALVVESRETKVEDLKKIIKLIQNVGGNIEGVILNKKKIKGSEYKKGYYYSAQSNTNPIDIKTYSVKELIKNRRQEEYTEGQLEVIEKEDNDEQIIQLINKINEINNKIQEVSDINIQNYEKIAQDIKNAYDKELDKNKLAEYIKESIVNNKLIEKIEASDKKSEKYIQQTIQELAGYMQNILSSKLDTIEKKVEQKVSINEASELINKLNDLESLVENNLKAEDIEEILSKKLSSLETVKSDDIEQMLSKNLEGIENERIKEKLEIIDKLSQIEEELKDNNQTTELNIINNKLATIQNSIIYEVSNIFEDKINSIDDKKEIEILLSKIDSIEDMVSKNVSVNELSEVLNKLEIIENISENNLKIEEVKEILNKEIEGLENVKAEDIEEILSKKLSSLETVKSDDIEQMLSKNLEGIENERIKEKLEIIDKLSQIEEELKDNNQTTELNIINNKLATIQNSIIYEVRDILEDKINSIEDREEIEILLSKIDSLEDMVSKNVSVNELSEILNKLEIIENISENNLKIEEVQVVSNRFNNIENIMLQNINSQSNNLNELEIMKDRLNEIENLIGESNKTNELELLSNKLNKVEDLLSSNIQKDEVEKIYEKLNDLENIIVENEIKRADNTTEINQIIEEIKKLNQAYKSIENKVINRDNVEVVKTKDNNKTRNNVIQFMKRKEKVKQDEIVIKYGQNIDYEELLEFAIDEYDLYPNAKRLKASAE